ncbi:MAG: outer membrane beta-barrel protein [Sulfurimonas sp.]|nr:outer membrane beta-barrel protein [Sulfurimonas sp.]
MKKLLFFLLITTSLYSEAKIYVGSAVGYLSETFDATDESYDANMLRIKAGYGDRAAYAIEFSVDVVEKDKNIFSQNDKERYGLNVELVKAFDLGIYVNPFFKAGFGAGFIETSSTTQSTIHYGSFNLGAGMFIPLGEHFDIELGYSYKGVSYEREENTSQDEGRSSNVNIGYIGFNARF